MLFNQKFRVAHGEPMQNCTDSIYKNKLRTRKNIIGKLSGTSWGCHANVFHTSALILHVQCSKTLCAQKRDNCKKVDLREKYVTFSFSVKLLTTSY